MAKRSLDVRTLFISDVHLGTPECQARSLTALLNRVHCDKLYLIGDIVDAWRLQRQWYWTQEHTGVVEAILHKSHSGTEVIYIPGNHDEFLRSYVHFGMKLADSMFLRREDVHTTADGRRLLVTHGDEFDCVTRYGRWLTVFGAWSWELAIVLNGLVHQVRRRLGMPYWSLSGFLAQHWKQAAQMISNYETALAEETARRGLDGVVCGHIHQPRISSINGLTYLNDGDWVENCSALVEHHDGSFELLFEHANELESRQLVASFQKN